MSRAERWPCLGLLLAVSCTAAVASAQAGDWRREWHACGGFEGEEPTYRQDGRPALSANLSMDEGFRVGGVDYRATLNASPPPGGGASAGLDIRQLYVEGKGYGLAPSTAFWAGKRIHLRTDARIAERFFTDLSGVGAGFDAPLGAARLGLSYFKTDANAVDSGKRLNIDVHEIGVNPRGKLRLVGTLTQGGTGGTGGLGLIAMHTQDSEAGLGSHTLWLEYAQGSAGLDGNFGGLSDPANVRKWRVVQSLGVRAGDFSGRTMALWEADRNAASTETHTAWSGQGTFTRGKGFKLVMALAHVQRRPQGAPPQKLTRITLSPTLSVGVNHGQRPELSLYASHVHGTAAAGQAFDGWPADAGYGAHALVWF